MDLTLETTAVPQGWRVHLAVSLDRRETNELFLAGDKLISWPTDGMLSGSGQGPFERSSMFLSEIVARPAGLDLLFEREDLADRVARILAFQVQPPSQLAES
jgi:hypothetical protein